MKIVTITICLLCSILLQGQDYYKTSQSTWVVHKDLNNGYASIGSKGKCEQITEYVQVALFSGNITTQLRFRKTVNKNGKGYGLLEKVKVEFRFYDAEMNVYDYTVYGEYFLVNTSFDPYLYIFDQKLIGFFKKYSKFQVFELGYGCDQELMVDLTGFTKAYNIAFK